MAILDYRGQPVKLGDLKQELAATNLMSARTPWYHSVVFGLTPERLAAIILGVDQGDGLQYLTLAEEMEERDLHYASVLGTRKRAVSGLSPVVEAATDKAEDVDIAEELTAIVKGSEFCELLTQQLDALGKGYAVSEIMWDQSEKQWAPKCFLWRDPRYFMFDRITGAELRLRDAGDLALGVPLAPYKFVVHRPQLKMGLTIRSGLARLACVAFMCKSYTIKDWLAFAEVFGMPIRIGKYDQNVQPEQKRDLLRAVANIGTDAAAIIPDTMEIEFIESAKSTGGDVLFKVLADFMDSQVSKGVLGQTMTTDNGSSLSQAQVHNEVREDIKDDDAKKLAATIRRDLIKPYIDLNYGPRKEREYPTLRLVVEEREDLESLATALPPFIALGLRVEESVIRDKFALPEPDPDARLLQPKEIVSMTGIKNDVQQKAGMMTAQDHEKLPQDATNPNAPGSADQIGKKGAQDPQPADYSKSLQRAAQELIGKVAAGKTLTDDQRHLLALAAQVPDDEIDRLVGLQVSGWKKVMGPAVDPIVALARSATSYDDFLKKLETLTIDTSELAQAVAVSDFKARGLGDSQDSPKI